MHRAFQISLALAICSGVAITAAAPIPNRSWVSGIGDDASPCSRTEPCKTFAGAISKTAAGGEISVLDSGAFGTVTIVKSITISGDGALAGIVASGQSGITIDDPATPATIAVTLRNLSIVGNSSAVTGIRMLKGAALMVDRVTIAGFANGIETTLGDAVVIDATLTRNGYAVHAIGGSITVENSTLTNNSVAVQSETGGTVRLSNSSLYDNLTGFGCGGGILATANNNRKGNNTGGIVPACVPNAAVTLQ
jgi:hypothetical protein